MYSHNIIISAFRLFQLCENFGVPLSFEMGGILGSRYIIRFFIIQLFGCLGWLCNTALAQLEISERVTGSANFPDIGIAFIGNLAVFVTSLLRGRLDLEMEMGARDILATMRGPDLCKCIVFWNVEEIVTMLARRMPGTIKRLSDSLCLLPCPECLETGCHGWNQGQLNVEETEESGKKEDVDTEKGKKVVQEIFEYINNFRNSMKGDIS